MIKSTKNFLFLCITLSLMSYASAKDIVGKYSKEINFDSIYLTQNLAGDCPFEIVSDFREFISKQQADAVQWSSIIDKKIKNAEVISGNNVKNLIDDSNVNSSKNNKAVTLIYESQRAGLDRNFMAAYTIYWSKQPSKPNTMKQLFPIGSEKLAEIKRKTFDTKPNFQSICWSPTSFRTNLRMFTAIFRGYLDLSNGDVELALNNYFLSELKFSEKAANSSPIFQTW